MLRRRSLWPLLLLLSGLVVNSVHRTVFSQIRRPGQSSEAISDAFLPAPRGLRQQLSQAQRAISEGQFGDAVDRLGRLLADSELDTSQDAGRIMSQDYFLDVTADGPGTRVSLKSQVRQLLGSMPAKGRELYELKFGADARQLLQRAVADGDIQQLLEVTRRYFHTQAGNEATLILGRYYLDQGQPLAAALSFQRLISTVDGPTYEPALSVLLATSWYLARMPERARETLLELKSRMPGAKFRVGDEEVTLFSEDNEALTWLAAIVGDILSSGPLQADQWTMYRGDASRNAASVGDFPLQHARWRVRTVNHPSDEQAIRRRRQQFRDQGIPALPGFHPLAVADVILMRSPHRLIAVDLDTGKRIWEFPWFEASDPSSLAGDQVKPQLQSRVSRALELDQRVWDDAAFGQMSSDGRQVFILWELGHATSSNRRMQVIVRPGGQIQPGAEGPVVFNKLVALDLKEQGKLRWIVGGEDGTDEPRCAGFFFLGTPLPLMDQLFVMAEVNSELRLVVLDAQTGELKWSQQVAHVDMHDITQDPLRRLAGASPSFSDGVLICPTSSGAVVAVDVATRSLLWGYQYPQNRRSARSRSSVYQTSATAEIGDRWADATATIADGRVLLTPVESDYLYCLNLLTGEPCWPPRPRNGLLYTGCVHRGQAILVGQDCVEAISLADGKTTWKLTLPSGMPSGRGLLANGAFFLPTTTKQLLKIDVSNGQIIRTQSTSDVLGNLVAYRDQIVSQGVDWLAVYHQAEPLRHKIRERLEDNPDDIWALARQAELFLFDDKRKESLKVLEHAHELAPEDESIRSLLVTSLLSALHEDFASYRQFADDLERLIDQPARRAEYYRLMAVGLQDAGEPTLALEYFIKLATFETSPLRRGIDASEVLVEVEPQLRVRRDRWIKSQLSKMIRSASGPALEEIQRTIDDHLQTVIASGSVNRLRRFVNQFGGDVAVSRARLELARRLIQHQSWLEAELHLVDLNSIDSNSEQQPEIAATATAMLAELLLDSGRLSESAYYYSQLNEKWGDIPVNGPVTGQELARRALQQEQLAEIVNQQAKWPSGKSRFERIETPPRQFQRYLRVYPVQLDNAVGPYLRQHHVAYNQSMNSLLIRDELGTPTSEILLGDTSRFYSSDYSTSSISAKGHLLFVAIGYEVLAIDMLRSGSEQSDSILWRKDLSSSLGSVATTQRRLMTQPIKRDWGPDRYVPVERTRKPIGLVGPITRSGVFYQKGQELTCSDPLTGEAIWIRGGLEPGSDIFGDEQLLFVVGPASDEAIVLNTANGEELGRRAIPPRQTRWLTSGRCVLNCASHDGQLEIQFLDVWEQAAVWQRTVDQRSQCCRVDSEEIAVLEPSGEFAILRIVDGSPRVETTLQAEPDLARLFVLPSNDDYLVAASDIRDNSINSSVSGNRVFGPLGLDHCRLINGHMYCFDRHSGESLWPRPATIRQFSLPLDQPTGTPLVVLLRHISKRKSGQSRGSTTTASLLCLDRRTGSQVLREDEMPALRSYAVTGDPQENSVDIMTNSVGFRVTFTDESAQDTSPLQMQEPVSALETFEKVRNRIANSILDAITKKPAEQDAPGETDNKQPEKKD